MSSYHIFYITGNISHLNTLIRSSAWRKQANKDKSTCARPPNYDEIETVRSKKHFVITRRKKNKQITKSRNERERHRNRVTSVRYKIETRTAIT